MISLVLKSLLAFWGVFRMVGGWLRDRRQRAMGRAEADYGQFTKAKEAQARMDAVEPADSDTTRKRLRDGEF